MSSIERLSDVNRLTSPSYFSKKNLPAICFVVTSIALLIIATYALSVALFKVPDFGLFSKQLTQKWAQGLFIGGTTLLSGVALFISLKLRVQQVELPIATIALTPISQETEIVTGKPIEGLLVYGKDIDQKLYEMIENKFIFESSSEPHKIEFFNESMEEASKPLMPQEEKEEHDVQSSECIDQAQLVIQELNKDNKSPPCVHQLDDIDAEEAINQALQLCQELQKNRN